MPYLVAGTILLFVVASLPVWHTTPERQRWLAVLILVIVLALGAVLIAGG